MLTLYNHVTLSGLRSSLARYWQSASNALCCHLYHKMSKLLNFDTITMLSGHPFCI